MIRLNGLAAELMPEPGIQVANGMGLKKAVHDCVQHKAGSIQVNVGAKLTPLSACFQEGSEIFEAVLAQR